MKMFLACVVAVGIGCAATAMASGGSSTSALKASVDYPNMAVHAAKARGKTSSTYKYYETDPFTVNGGADDGASAKCPKNYSAISGYWGADGPGVVSDYNAVGNSSRKWSVAVRNLDTGPHQTFVGVVCAHN